PWPRWTDRAPRRGGHRGPASSAAPRACGGRRRQRSEELGELTPRDGVVGAEGRGVLSEQPDLRGGPRGGLGAGRGAGRTQAEEEEEKEAAGHASPSIGASPGAFRLPAVRVEIRPEPPEGGTAEAIRRAVRPSNTVSLAPPALQSAWRRAGLDYATALPRSSRGAGRAESRPEPPRTTEPPRTP